MHPLFYLLYQNKKEKNKLKNFKIAQHTVALLAIIVFLLFCCGCSNSSPREENNKKPVETVWKIEHKEKEYFLNYSHEENNTETTTETQAETTPEETETTIMETSPETTQEITPETTKEYNPSTLETYLNKVPSNILSFLYQKGWTIQETDRDLGDYQYWDNGVLYDFHIRGVAYFNTREIFVRPDGIETSTLHEVGHAIDYEMNWISSGEEFRSIYISEKAQFFIQDSHDLKDESEYFAEAFQQYFLNGNTMKATTPRTYSFIENIVVNFGEVMEESTKTYIFSNGVAIEQ